MPPLRKRSSRKIADNPPQSEIPMENHKHEKSEYELAREERIRENRERMGKLGIFDISDSLKLKRTNPSSRPAASKNPKSLNPSRRSTRFFHFHPQNSIFHYIYHNPTIHFFSLVFRLQNVSPVHYTEEAINKRIYWKKRVKKTRPKLLPDSSYTWWKYGRKQLKGSIRYVVCILHTSRLFGKTPLLAYSL